jgi:tRNA modification GTPase
MRVPNSDETIVAIATPPGHGGIGVVRISGWESFQIASGMVRESVDFSEAKSHSILRCTIKGEDSRSFLDEVLVSVFRAPTSYTGEDVVEISAHGNPQILKQIVELAIDLGAREATPGEFTLRAFLSGRIDLVQAEAVADLIVAESSVFQRAAVYQLSGKLSEYIGGIRAELIEIGALFEAYTDFPEDEIPQTQKADLAAKLDDVGGRLSRLAQSYQRGRIIRSGIQVPIVGPPNAGKSSLFNAILSEERAIVTEIPGTTRDTISETIELAGFAVRFIDTAGLREATNEIESLGVARSQREIEASSVLIAVFDISTTSPEAVTQTLQAFAGKTPVVVFNKIDLMDRDGLRWFGEQFSDFRSIFVSAKQLLGIDLLLSHLTDWLTKATPITAGDGNVLTNERHYRATNLAVEAIKSVQSGLQRDEGFEMLAFDLRQVIGHLEEILGKITNDEILAEIFSRFCIGK